MAAVGDAGRFRERTIVGVLVQRGMAMWVLLRLFVLALDRAQHLLGAAPPIDAGGPSLFFSFAPIPIIIVMSAVLAEVDVRRRHEHALLGNLGLSIPTRVGIAAGMAIAGELALGILLPLVRG